MSFRFWRLIFHSALIVKDDTFKPAYPSYYIRLPRYFKRKSHCGFAWGIFLKHSFEIIFITNPKRYYGEIE